MSRELIASHGNTFAALFPAKPAPADPRRALLLRALRAPADTSPRLLASLARRTAPNN